MPLRLTPAESFAMKLFRHYKSFKLEEEIASQLSFHPNIATYEGSWTHPEVHAMCFEYVRGVSLLDILMERALEEDEAHGFFKQLITGMDHAHNTCGIAHRDLKAENLMISEATLQLKIIDWGMGIRMKQGMTVNQTCGSPDYSAPEIYLQKPYTGQDVDIWAMGVILYAMVTGDFPFPGRSAEEIRAKVCKGVYIWPLVSSSLAHLISRMLTVDQKSRITFEEIKEHPWFLGHNRDAKADSLLSPIEPDDLREEICDSLDFCWISTKQQPCRDRKHGKRQRSSHAKKNRNRACAAMDISDPALPTVPISLDSINETVILQRSMPTKSLPSFSSSAFIDPVSQPEIQVKKKYQSWSARTVFTVLLEKLLN